MTKKVNANKKASKNKKLNTKKKVNINKKTSTKKKVNTDKKLNTDKVPNVNKKKPSEQFKIVIVNNKSTIHTQKSILEHIITKYPIIHIKNKEEAIKKFNELIKENQEKVKFAKLYKNIKHNGVNEIRKTNIEILLLKKKNSPDETSFIKDKVTGELIQQINSNVNWIIYKKNNWLVEDYFWVYGYNPLVERKNYYFIFDEIIMKNNEHKSIVVYLNKVIIDYGDDLDFVICKNKDDAIRLYNILKKDCKNYSNIFFLGFLASSVKHDVINRLLEKTGWNYQKIKRSSTRP